MEIFLRHFFRAPSPAHARERALAGPTARRVGVESCYCAGIWFYINSCTAGGREPRLRFYRMIK